MIAFDNNRWLLLEPHFLSLLEIYLTYQLLKLIDIISDIAYFFFYNIKMNNYFELLAIEKSYNVDLKILNQQYFAMQGKFHPDKARSHEEKQRNLSISIELNKAYAVLKDDLQRAEYLLFLSNINLDDQSIKQTVPKAQLSLIWDELEIIEETNELNLLEQIYNNKLLEQKAEIKLLNEAFPRYSYQEGCHLEDKNVADIINITIRLKYLKTLIDRLKLKIKFCK